MMNNLVSYLVATILIFYGIRAIISFIKNDKKDYFPSTTTETLTVKKTIGREYYIRFKNLIWGILSLIGGIAVIITILRDLNLS